MIVGIVVQLIKPIIAFQKRVRPANTVLKCDFSPQKTAKSGAAEAHPADGDEIIQYIPPGAIVRVPGVEHGL